MVRVGIFGTSGELDRIVIKMMIDEVLEQCREATGGDEVESLVSHASGAGIGRYVFEEGTRRGLKNVGMVLPSCRENSWVPVDETVYVGEEWGDEAISDCGDVLDVIVWVGDVDPKRDWVQLANLSDVKMLSVSDSMVDWASPSSVFQLSSIIDKVLAYTEVHPETYQEQERFEIERYKQKEQNFIDD